jgi:hypothetical protein
MILLESEILQEPSVAVDRLRAHFGTSGRANLSLSVNQ